MSAISQPAERISFERYPSGTALLEALRQASVDTDDLETIATICNQPSVRQWVIDARVGAEHVYTMIDAAGFVAFAEAGWREGRYFVYVIRNAAGRIVGAIDIKSSDREGAEVGYWSDTEGEGGYMTNAISALGDVAREAGYKRLYARVAAGNKPSAAVLSRGGFTRYEHEPKDPRSPKAGYVYFQKLLAA
jgi:RimJ/RimL family protein N-acetyltransferase